MSKERTVVFACVIYYNVSKSDCYVHRLIECKLDQDNANVIHPKRLIRERPDERESVPPIDPTFQSNEALLQFLEKIVIQGPLEKVPKSYQRVDPRIEADYLLTSYRKKFNENDSLEPSQFFPMPFIVFTSTT